jgi:hypothetical protein
MRTDAAARIAAFGALGADAAARHLLRQLLDPNIRFPARPVFVDDIDMFEMPDGLGFFISGFEAPVLLRGRFAHPAIAYLRQMLDGTRTVEHLLTAAPTDLPMQALIRTMLVLHSKGLLSSEATKTEYNGDDVGRRQLLYWGRHLAVTRSASSASEIDRRLTTARVLLLGSGLFGTAVADLLSRTGVGAIEVVSWDDGGSLSLAVGDLPGMSTSLLATTDVY